MSKMEIKVFYAKGIRLHLANRSFKEAMNLIWISPAFSDYEPVSIYFPATGKVLYADKPAFLDYLNAEISIDTLIKLTECDNMYRNTTDLKTEEGLVVDKGSLWKAIGKELTLIDDDYDVTAVLNKLLFEIAE